MDGTQRIGRRLLVVVLGVAACSTPVVPSSQGLGSTAQLPSASTEAPSSVASSQPIATPIPTPWVPPAVPAGAGWHRLDGTPMVAPLTWAGTDESTILRFDGLDIFVGNREDPAIWFSGDGVSWQAAEGIDVREDPDREEIAMMGLATTGTAVVAFAEHWSESYEKLQVVLWRSVDGRTWTRVADPPLPPGMRFYRVGATSGGFVVFGLDTTAPRDRWAHGWTSTDGSTWQPITSETASAMGAGLELLADIDGVLTAFTNADPVVGPLDVWQASPDDLTSWQRVGQLGSEPWGFLSLAKGPGGWVAIGRAIYRSVDGRAWSPALDPRPVSPDYPEGRIALVGDDLGFIATTNVPTGEGCAASGFLGMTWASADGVTWRRLPVDPQFESATIFGLISRAGVVLGLGWGNTENESTSAIWIADRAALTSGADSMPSPSATSGGCGPQ